MRVLGNQPRSSAMIFGVGANSTNKLPPRVEIFLDGLNGFSLPVTSRTNILPNRAAERLVTQGPFAISRNPIYLGNTTLMFGIGLAFNALWFLPLAICAAAFVERLAIRREEAHLALLFGPEWAAYATTTARWL